MACKQCKKDITGNFIVFNFGAGTVDKKGNSTPVSKGMKLSVWMDIMSHSDKRQEYHNTKLYKSTFKMDWSLQMEEYFCSKECLAKWFEKQLEKIKNP